MKRLNLGVVAHVDAGKTSLTERLLFDTGALDAIGSVDAGSTRTDSLALERERGITIRSAVASFVIGDVGVNLLDTPGHPDFIAEVERVLGVLDGAVLVVSAVEGVQPQTLVLMRALRRLRVPTLIFVNKIDRGGARADAVLAGIADRLTPRIVAMGSVTGLGSREAGFRPYGQGDHAFTARLLDLLSSDDDALVAAYLQDEAAVTHEQLLHSLAGRTRRGQAHPVFFGSAITGAGVPELLAGIARLLPPADDHADGPLSGTVFKIERGRAGEKLAYVRLFSGSLGVRDRVELRGRREKVTGVGVFTSAGVEPRGCAVAGEIAQLRGLSSARIGDPIGLPAPSAGARQFAPPTLETVVEPVDTADKGSLYAALAQLAEQDPLIGLRRDELRGEVSLSLYGEVQKQVISATLEREFAVKACFRQTRVICVERLVGSGAAVEFIDVAPNPFLATVGLRVEPAAVGAGVRYRLEVELGSMPYALMRAIEETVRLTLRQGLYGWEVPDCVVTLTHTGYWPRQSHMHGSFDKSMSSTAGDFRNLTPLVLMQALRQAGTRVCEPVHAFTLEAPTASYGAVLPVLGQLGAVPSAPSSHGRTYLLTGVIPAARVHELQQRLPGLTGGEGVLESAFSHYAVVEGFPSRPRTDANPLDRAVYLLHVQRRV
ncbi:MAG TPA: translation factor GTPase family protein [Jatrophihabitans sp.]|uniref:GTP-binding protein n=1 Tax=Jatrophihabitans sp. TaxID=1932789 RepID=UPI002EFC5610